MATPLRRGWQLIARLLLAGALGCRSAFYWVVMPFVYREASLPEEQIVRDLLYRSDPGADTEKHRLDLFVPEAAGNPHPRPWPVLVFVHGGGWTSGDKGLRTGGADVYANIGRYFAARGVGVAVISYRLQPAFDWRDQVEDVARAVAWVHAHVAEYGGEPDAIFVSGHSAGAQLAARVALDRELAGRFGAPAVCGLISVSGAGFDLADAKTYELGASRAYYEQRFRVNGADANWQHEASSLRFADAKAPPTLIVYADGDWPSLHRQAELLDAALRDAGAARRTLIVSDEDHYSIILALSRDDKQAAPAMLEFIRDTDC